MKKDLGRLLAASMAMASLSAPALAADNKITNGAACVPIVTSSNVPSTQTVVTKLGARMSTQVVAGDPSARALTFVCPVVRDAGGPVSLSMQVNTFNAAGAGDFACNMKTVAENGTLVDNQLVYVLPGFQTTEWGSIFATSSGQAYVLVCVVPNVVGGQQSGIISYRWIEEAI